MVFNSIVGALLGVLLVLGRELIVGILEWVLEGSLFGGSWFGVNVVWFCYALARG